MGRLERFLGGDSLPFFFLVIVLDQEVTLRRKIYSKMIVEHKNRALWRCHGSPALPTHGHPSHEKERNYLI